MNKCFSCEKSSVISLFHCGCAECNKIHTVCLVCVQPLILSGNITKPFNQPRVFISCPTKEVLVAAILGTAGGHNLNERAV